MPEGSRAVVFMLSLLLFGAGCKDMGTDVQESPPRPVPPTPGTVSFAQRVLPILQRNGCVACHGGSGGLYVGTVSQLITGGNHGPAVIAGQADNSTLIKKLLNNPPFGVRMPDGGPYLPDSTVNVLRTWINEGAQNN